MNKLQFNVGVMGNITVEADTLEQAIALVSNTLVGNEAIGLPTEEVIASLQLNGDNYEL